MPVFQKVVHEFRLSFRKFRDSKEEILVKKLTRDDFEPFLFEYIRGFYFRAHCSESWVDKTPTDEAAHGLSLVEAIFSDAKILATKRTGIEVVNSYLRKFNSPFAEACTSWASTMQGILMARDSCTCMLEIDQFDIAKDPYGTAHKIVSHLGRSGFGDALGQFFAKERVEKSSTHDWRRRLTLADVEWSPEQRDCFVQHCGKMMEAFGYAM